MMAQLARYAASVAGLGAFALLAALYASDRTAILYVNILYYWGIDPFAFPFLDFAGYLSSLECMRHGVDVIAANPCDPLERAFNYGPLWLDLTFLPLYPPYRLAGGVLLGVVFLASFAFLPPPTGWRDRLFMVLGAVSAAVVFAVERANPDILIYLLLFLACTLLARRGMARAAGYLLIWFTAGLKFYPASLLAMAVRERMARFLLLVVLSVLLLGLYLLRYYDSLVRIFPLLPAGDYDSDLFAAKNLPMRFGQVTHLALAPSALAMPAALLVGVPILALLVRRAVRQVRRLLREPGFAIALARMEPGTYLLLLSGCLLIAGCFFTLQNIAYRAIFLLYSLPGFLILARADTPAIARLGRVAARVAVFLLWESTFRVGLARGLVAIGMDEGAAFMLRLLYWVFRELVWWWMASVMLAIILHFLWTSPVRRVVWRWAG